LGILGCRSLRQRRELILNYFRAYRLLSSGFVMSQNYWLSLATPAKFPPRNPRDL
jgi:hypothetical protein